MLRPAPKDRSAVGSRQPFGSAAPRPRLAVSALEPRRCAEDHGGSSPLSPLPGEAMKLNGATIPDEIVRRVVERRGTEHCFAELDPARTALVVIDLQHAFMNEAVGHAVVPAARDIVPAVNRLAAAVRQT